MKSFRTVSGIDLGKISANNIKNLTAERQIKAIRLWADQNIRKYGPCGTQNGDAEMRQFITDVANHFELNTDSALFRTALATQKGWGPAWKAKVFNTAGTIINLDDEPLVGSDSTLQGAIARIIQDRDVTGHGNTVLGGSHADRTHWRSGSLRIFGTLSRAGNLTLVGIGRHTGSGNSSYSVQLLGGGSTTAQTG